MIGTDGCQVGVSTSGTFSQCVKCKNKNQMIVNGLCVFVWDKNNKLVQNSKL